MIPKEGDHFARRCRIGRGAMGIVMEAVHETLDTLFIARLGAGWRKPRRMRRMR